MQAAAANDDDEKPKGICLIYSQWALDDTQRVDQYWPEPILSVWHRIQFSGIFSALEADFSALMRYINSRFTYLLTYLAVFAVAHETTPLLADNCSGFWASTAVSSLLLCYYFDIGLYHCLGSNIVNIVCDNTDVSICPFTTFTLMVGWQL